MLVNASRIINFPVLSVHVGGPIAWIDAEIVDPEKLKIIAFYVGGPAIQNDPEVGDILETRDIREFSQEGMIIDSDDKLVNKGDVIRLDKILELNFSLVGLKVETKKGTKLGKVIDFTVDSETFTVQQLVVKRPLTKSFLDPELLISRKEIVEVNDYKIIVKDEEEKIRKRATREDFIPNFVNPFREPSFSATRARKERDEPGV